MCNTENTVINEGPVQKQKVQRKLKNCKIIEKGWCKNNLTITLTGEGKQTNR